jgi:hypothetical protein
MAEAEGVTDGLEETHRDTTVSNFTGELTLSVLFAYWITTGKNMS